MLDTPYSEAEKGSGYISKRYATQVGMTNKDVQDIKSHTTSSFVDISQEDKQWRKAIRLEDHIVK